MSFSRRRFMQAGAAVIAGTSLSTRLKASQNQRHSDESEIRDPSIKQIANIALDTAQNQGAVYADARLDHSYETNDKDSAKESMAIGVRVLVDGYWGFASSPVWSKDEAARLGRTAVRNARANAIGQARYTELAQLNGAKQQLVGHWSTPIIDDPFLMSKDEIEDFIKGVRAYFQIGLNVAVSLDALFTKQDKLFVSTIGHSITQQLYHTSGHCAVEVKVGNHKVGVALDTLSIAAAGFEYIRDQPIREQIFKLIEETKADMSLPVVPVDVGRYETILDAHTVSALLSESIGAATELDRALGYEANAAGTSYIIDPLQMIDTLKVGSPSVTITANRSEALGAATVRWDDEGVMPSNFTLIKDGILTDMQTDRESASVLNDVYSRRGVETRSHGCSYAPHSGFAPLTHSANLQITPGTVNESFDSLIKGVEKGIAFKLGSVNMDHQQNSGLLFGHAFEVKDGKRVSNISGAAISFRTPELWSAVSALGGSASAQRIGLEVRKGQPVRTAVHSSTGVPVVLKEATIIDILRKA